MNKLITPIIRTLRASIIESEHFGFILTIDANRNILKQFGESESRPFLLRSAQKPFQAIPIIETGAFEKFRLEPKHLAICCGSHSGSFDHTETVREILTKIGLDESFLKCGIHPPLDKETRMEILKHDMGLTPLQNNCSGKHAGMLATCVHMNWDLNNYLDINHPLQKMIIKRTKEICDFNEQTIAGLDGCDAPVLSMPLKNMGIGLTNLTKSSNLNIIIKSCCENSNIFGGSGRLDSQIIEETSGRLFAKVGAEGLCVVLNPLAEQSLIIKISDANMDARAIATIEALKQLKWINDREYKNLSNFYPKKLFTHSGKTAGEYEVNFEL